MAVINRVPTGLLGLLQAKTLGQTPPDIANFVQGSLDMLRLYLTNIPVKKANITQTGITAPAYAGEVDVPSGELWAVLAAGSQIIPDGTTTPTGNWRFGTVARTPWTNQTIPLKTVETNMAFIGPFDIMQITQVFPEIMFFSPGTRFETRVFSGDFSSAGTGITATTQVNYHPIPV